MMSYVATPQLRRTLPAAIDLRHPTGARIGIVLRVSSSTGTRMFPGIRAEVLLIDPVQRLQDVIVPVEGGGAKNMGSVAPTATAADLLADVESAFKGERPMPTLCDRDPRWGSWVVIDWFATGLPYIKTALPHPATEAKRIPVVPQKPSPMDLAAKACVDNLVAIPPDLPEALTDEDAIAVPPPPVAYAGKPDTASWTAAYIGAWQAAAEDAYLGLGQDLSGTFGGPFAPAKNDGWSTGLRDGAAAGRQALADSPPTEPKVVPVPVQPLTPETETGDDDSGDTKGAVTTGDDRFLEHGGSRFVMQEDGTVIWDTQRGGRLLLQSGDNGARITASGATIDVGADGAKVNVKADHVTLDSSDVKLGQSAVDALLVSGARTPCPLNPGGHIGGCSSGKAV